MNYRAPCFLIVLAGFLVLSSVASVAMTAGSYGGRKYLLHKPVHSGASDSRPLLLMLHGCTQTPRGFARATGMNELANQRNFLVVYPEQTRRDNRRRCWNWFRPGDTNRGQGEVAELAGLTRSIVQDHQIDDARIYVAGFSAGGGMAPALAVAYPDLYAAVGVHSGFEYRAARTVKQAFGAMNGGGPDPVNQGRKAVRAMGKRARAIPTMVIHGRADTIVKPINGRQATRQAVETIRRATQKLRSDSPLHYRLPTEPDLTVNRESTYTTERRDYHFADGRLAVRYLVIRNMGHAWAGGVAGESYVASAAPDASERLWEFFDRHSRNGIDDRVNTPPVASLEANRTSLGIGDTLTITAKASDIDGTVQRLEWFMGGEKIGEESSLRYRFREAGSHKLTLRVRDNSGAKTTRSILITVDGGNESSTLPELERR